MADVRAVATALPTRESLAQVRRRVRKILARLQARYPEVRVPLHHRDPFQLLISTILSAQCTDAMVNRVTPVLFEKFRTPEEFAAASPRELEGIIKPTGFFHQKAKAIINASRSLVERFGGRVPLTMDELLTLEGVGRKTANVLLSAKRLEPWGEGGDPDDGLGVVVDTHVRRLSQRLALAGTEDPEKIEQALIQLIPRAEWDGFSLRLIYFGREVCTAKRPLCPTCPLNTVCPSARYRGSPPWMRRRVRGDRRARSPRKQRQRRFAR